MEFQNRQVGFLFCTAPPLLSIFLLPTMPVAPPGALPRKTPRGLSFSIDGCGVAPAVGGCSNSATNGPVDNVQSIKPASRGAIHGGFPIGCGYFQRRSPQTNRGTD